MTTSRDDRIGPLIERLVAEARPVRRLRPPAVRLALWLAVLLVVATLALAAGVRADLAVRLGAHGYLGELACLTTAAVAAAWIALRRAVPGLEPGAAPALLATAGLAAGVLGAVETHFSPTGSLASFVAAGLPCTLQSLTLAAVPWVALVWAVRGGAPLHPTATCGVAGLGAALGAYLLMRLRCPAEDTLHVAVWHGTPVVIATALAAVVGVLLARRPPVGRAP